MKTEKITISPQALDQARTWLFCERFDCLQIQGFDTEGWADSFASGILTFIEPIVRSTKNKIGLIEISAKKIPGKRSGWMVELSRRGLVQ